jgi:hypothetical protein
MFTGQFCERLDIEFYLQGCIYYNISFQYHAHAGVFFVGRCQDLNNDKPA